MIEQSDLGAAVDEIYALRALLADAADVFTDALTVSSIAARRRRAMEKQVTRLTAAARGACARERSRAEVLGKGFSQKQALSAVGAEDCLTNHQWLQQAGRGEAR